LNNVGNLLTVNNSVNGKPYLLTKSLNSRLRSKWNQQPVSRRLYLGNWGRKRRPNVWFKDGTIL